MKDSSNAHWWAVGATSSEPVPVPVPKPMPEHPPMPGLRERKKERTKAAIQPEALRLFSRDGYGETSVEQIAAAAEVSPSTFFRYFATKEDVVLADFFDSRAVQRVLDAPAELTPLQALRFALTSVVDGMVEEDMELERLRNELIQSVPELRRGMISEMVRPTRLFADAIAQRKGRPTDDPDVVMFAGATIGGMITTAGMDTELSTPHSRDVIARAIEQIDRLERMLTLPD